MQETLNAHFRAPLKDFYRRRIVVWEDEDGEFADIVADMSLENARILILQWDHMFELRRQIEVDYADENLLLYCPLKFEKPQDNFLLDVFLYSETFRADYWSLLFDELGIANTRAVRAYAKTVAAFFKSRERRTKLHSLRNHYANERELQTGIFCVLCGTKAYGFAEVLKAVLSCGTDAENTPLSTIAKFCGDGTIWRACEDEYGYVGEHDSDALACHLLATAAMNAADEAVFTGLPFDAAYATKAYGFFVDWMRTDRETLAQVCQHIEEKYRVEIMLRRMNREIVMRMGVFPVADRILLADALTAFAEGRSNPEEVETLLQTRRDMPWHAEYAAYYDALRALNDMYRFGMAYRGGFHLTEPKTLWTAYAKELYRMDQSYRAFCVAYDRALSLGIMPLEDFLKAAEEAAERLYNHGFLNEVNSLWTQLIAAKGIPRVARQQDFYQQYILPAENRIYVVISDGLRYETAQALSDVMTARLPGNTQCGCMMGMLPGITPVGMAALLPHREIKWNEDKKIRCDGMSTEAGNRENVLRAACSESLTINYADFRQCSKARRGELVKGKKVVYIYHDTIDCVGESDGNVAQACETAMDELMQLMRILANELNAANVIITADHGFLYTCSPLEVYEKSEKEMLRGEIVECKRRYAIVHGEGDSRTVTLPLDELGQPELNAVFPMGCMRFRLQGHNACYVHGGLSLQEMMIPLVRYQNRKAGQKGFQAAEKTEVLLLGENRRISNNVFTLTFYQKKPCIGKVQPRTILARFEDAWGKMISDEHRLVFDRTETENNQRTLRATFRLLGSGYDRNAQYNLVLRDAEENAELERIPFRIDIVFENDFGF